MGTNKWNWQEMLGMLLCISHTAFSFTCTYVHHDFGPSCVTVDTILLSQQHIYGSTDNCGETQILTEERSVRRWQKLDLNRQALICVRTHDPDTLMKTEFKSRTRGTHVFRLWARTAKPVSNHYIQMKHSGWNENVQQSKVKLITSPKTVGTSHSTPTRCRSLNRKLRRAKEKSLKSQSKHSASGAKKSGKDLKLLTSDQTTGLQDASDIQQTIVDGLDKAIKREQLFRRAIKNATERFRSSDGVGLMSPTPEDQHAYARNTTPESTRHSMKRKQSPPDKRADPEQPHDRN